MERVGPVGIGAHPVIQSEAAPVPHGAMYRIESFPSALVPPRTVTIWLPDEYENTAEERFPVLYMQDGDMVFGAEDDGRGVARLFLAG